MLEERSEVGTGVGVNGARWAVVVVALVLAVGGLFGYSVHERTLARQKQIEKQQMELAMNQTREQIDAVTAKLNALTVAQQQAAEAEKRQLEAQHAAAIRGSRVRRKADDQRWNDVRSKLDAQGQAIDQTRSDLTSAKTELQGSIARTHDELVLLQRKGERSYYEFDLDKSKQFSRAGPLGVALRKADTKHQFADLELMVEDTKLQKKHVNLFEPVMFYRPDTQTPVELVINNVRKNHIHGYISEPKYRASQLQAQGSGPNDSPVASSSTPARQQSGSPELRRRTPQ